MSAQSGQAPAELVFTPEPGAWGKPVLAHWRSRGSTARARAFRRELGLPDDRPVVMTGHQAEVWHAGILAKHLAADAFAPTIDGAAAWLVADQDERTFDTLRAPVLTDAGSLSVETLTLASPPAGWATAQCRRFEPPPLQTRSPAATPSVSAGLVRIEAALREHAKEANAARQVAGALVDLAFPLLSASPAVLYAAELASTSLFKELVDRMVADPAGAIGAYNRAVGKHPNAGMRALALPADRSRIELPLWKLGAGELRKRVTGELAGIDRSGLAPTALLMTALVRLAGCDLFIHGLGGGAYDPITESWIRAWLGEELAPMAVVSATLLLPLEGAAATPADAARAAWLAHSARHDPLLVGDSAGARLKAEHLAAIASAKASGASPAHHFRAMHEALASSRRARAAQLEALASEVRRVRALVEGRAIAFDRTWPFPLHSDESLARLAETVARAVRGA